MALRCDLPSIYSGSAQFKCLIRTKPLHRCCQPSGAAGPLCLLSFILPFIAASYLPKPRPTPHLILIVLRSSTQFKLVRSDQASCSCSSTVVLRRLVASALLPGFWSQYRVAQEYPIASNLLVSVQPHLSSEFLTRSSNQPPCPDFYPASGVAGALGCFDCNLRLMPSFGKPALQHGQTLV
jgi:hypothetical protein